MSLMRSLGLEVEVFGSAQEFRNRPRPDGPSCLVLDVRLPGKCGLEFQHANCPTPAGICPSLFITGHSDIPMSVRAMKAGAVEFLTKPFRDQDLLDAIHVALERDRSTREHDAELGVLRARLDSLTPREREVQHLIVAGRLNKETGATLGTSEITVKVHRASIMRKMQADHVAVLVTMASRRGCFQSQVSRKCRRPRPANNDVPATTVAVSAPKSA
jgi:FixJ family two-component response regulator